MNKNNNTIKDIFNNNQKQNFLLFPNFDILKIIKISLFVFMVFLFSSFGINKAYADISYIGGVSGSGTTSTYDVDLTSLGLQQDDFVLVTTGWASITNGNPGVTTSGYTEATDLYSNDTRDANMSVSWKVMGTTPDTSVTCSGTNSALYGGVCIVQAYRGVDPSNPLDVPIVTAIGTNGAVINSPAITPVSINSLIISAGLSTAPANAGSTTISVPKFFSNEITYHGNGTTDSTQAGMASLLWDGSGEIVPNIWQNITTSTSDSWAAATLALRRIPVPEEVTLYNDDGGVNQIAFNNSRLNNRTPTLRVSANSTTTMSNFFVEFNTKSDFTGTSYNQIFSGAYNSLTPYNLQTTSALGIPATTGITYFIRVKASSNSGVTYGDWSASTWSYTYTSYTDLDKWFQTKDEQFNDGTLVATKTYGNDNVQVKNYNYVPTIDNFTESDGGAVTTASLTLTKPSNVSPGDLLLIMVGNSNSTATAQWNDTTYKPSGFTLINESGNSTDDTHTGAFYRIADGTEDDTIAVPAQSTMYYFGWYILVKGANTINPIDVIGADSNSTASVTSYDLSGVTTTVNNALAFYVHSYDGADSTDFSAIGEIPTWYKQSVHRIGTSSNYQSGSFGIKEMDTPGDTGYVTITDTIADGISGFTFAIRPLDPPTSGTIMSPEFDFNSIKGALSWGSANITTDETYGSINTSVYYSNISACDTLVPDIVLPGNSSGFTADNFPLDLTPIGPITYQKLCLGSTLTKSGVNTPYILDWSIGSARGSIPGVPTFYRNDGEINQVAFNNILINSTTPLIRVSDTYPAGFNTFNVEFNTKADFTGTSYTQTFSGSYTSDTPYNLQTTVSLGLPTTNGVTYYVRAQASADGGVEYGPWSAYTWSYTYTSTVGSPKWFQTTDSQFNDGSTFSNTETNGSGQVTLGQLNKPYIKVERGVVSYPDGVTSVDVDLVKPVTDTQHSFVLMSYKGQGTIGAQNVDEIFTQPQFLDNQTLRFSRKTGLNSAEISWQVVQADTSATTPAFYVERLSTTFGTTDTVKNLTASTITDYTKTMVIVYGNADTDNTAVAQFRAKMTSNSNLQITRNITGANSDVYAIIVQFSSAINIYNGETAITSSQTSINASIGGTVDLSRSALFMNYDADTNGLAQTAVRGYLVNATEVQFTKAATNGNNIIDWSVVEFPTGVVVQADNGSSSPATNSTNITQAITPVNDANTLVYATNMTTGTGSAFPRTFIMTTLPDTQTISFDVSYSGQTNTMSYYAIDFNGWTHASGSSGSILSPTIRLDSFKDLNSWGEANMSTVEVNSDVTMQVYYTVSTSCDTLVSDGVLAGNSSGFHITDMPLNLSSLSPAGTTYNKICLKANLLSTGGIPILNDWTVTAVSVSSAVPTVTTTNPVATTITDSSAILNGNITNIGQSTATIRGFDYGTDPTLITGTITTIDSGNNIENFESMTFPPTNWTTGGSVNWARDVSTTHLTSAGSATSGTSTPDNGTTWLSYSKTFSSAGELKFYWSVSSESNYDFLVFCMDINSTCSRTVYTGTNAISGTVGWTQVTIPVSAGTHDFRWLYGKDVNTTGGTDQGWVDDIEFIDSIGTGAYTSVGAVTGLSCATTYYARAYATNTQGTGRGDIISFITGACPDPYITNALGKTTDSWGGAIPVEMNLIGMSDIDYPYARAKVITAAAETYYFPMTWNSSNNKYEANIYPGSYYCHGCVDPTTGSFAVTTELDNNLDFSSIDYSLSAGNFTTFIARRRSSLDSYAYPTNYTDFNPVWETDHWAYTIKDLGFYQASGSTKSNVAIGIPFHPVTSTITNIGVTFNGSTVNPGTAASTSNAWWWDTTTHTLYIQQASMLNSTGSTNLTGVNITFNSDTDLWVSRYDHVETSDMGQRLFYNGLMIANQYYTTFMYGGGHEGAGEQAESRAHEPGVDDETADCMERVAIHVDGTTTADSSGYYTYDVKWKQDQWKDYITSENNNDIVVVNDSDGTTGTGWIQQLNKGVSVKRTQTYSASKKYIDNLYEVTNNDSVSHTLPMVWEREQWLSSQTGSVRQAQDAARFSDDTSDVVEEQRSPMSSYLTPWLVAYDKLQYISMGIIFDKNYVDSSTYGVSAVDAFLTSTTAEWPIVITNPHSTQTADQTGFEHTFSNVSPATTVSFHFAQLLYNTTSLEDIISSMDASYIDFNGAPTFITQSAYRLFSNMNDMNVGNTIASQDTPATLSYIDNFRLRLLLKSDSSLSQSAGNYKLQYSPRSGQCDVGFLGETYSDVTSDTMMSYYNNFSPEDGVALISNANDPTHGGDTIVNQTYVEKNNFTNSIASIPAGQDGKWDFSLYYKGTTSNDAYCFRVVNSDGSILNSYLSIPEVISKMFVSRGGGRVRSIVLPQCSDTLDNDLDTLKDELDPNCHLDGVLGNEYRPLWNSETTSPVTVTGGDDDGGSGNIVLPQCSDTLDNDLDTLKDELDPNCHLDGVLGNEYRPLWNSETTSPVTVTGGDGGDNGGGGDLGLLQKAINYLFKLPSYKSLGKLMLAMAFNPF